MEDAMVVQELSDDQLELVTGGHGRHVQHHCQHHGHGNGHNTHITNNVNVTIVEYQYNIVYAPVYVFGTVTGSNIDNGNTYAQGNS